MKLHILRCGQIRVSPAAALSGGSGAADTARMLTARERERVTLPVFCYLIEHPKGLVLMDTGWCRDISPRGVYDPKAVRQVLPAQLAALYRPCLPEGEAIHEQLAALGLRPEDLDCVLLTHMDADHTAGLRHLRGAKRMLVAEDEYFWSCRTVYKLRQPMNLWEGLPLERYYYRGMPLGTNRWAYDLFGDESLMLINLPGHTDGQAVIRLKSGGKFVILAADAAFSPQNWQELRPPGLGFDRGMQLKALHWLREQEADPACLGIFCSHDPAVQAQVLVI